MGEAPSSSSLTGFASEMNSGVNMISGTGLDSHGPSFTNSIDDAEAGQATSSNAPFYAQLHALPSRSESSQIVPQFPAGNHGSMHHLDRSAIANALPDAVSYHNPHPQDTAYGSRGFPNRPVLGPSYANPQFNSFGSAYRQPSYSTAMPHSPLNGQHSQPMPGYPIYGSYQPFASQLSMPPQNLGYPNGSVQYASPYGRPDTFHQGLIQPYSGLDPRSFVPTSAYNGEFVHSPVDFGPTHKHSIPEPTPNYPRGPPRKPKQSGHALWVGNLPPGTIVTDLKDHFSREATKDIESLFLISKSNCAFVNYRSETACSAAMSRFHDSRFNGVRLVCRLRRGSVSTIAPPTPAPSTPSPYSEDPSSPLKPQDSPVKTQASSEFGRERRQSQVVIASGSNAVAPVEDGNRSTTGLEEATPRVPEKYFIVKSLTLQDLDASVRNGIWATQSHNETLLNEAFESAENVYLVFSANKSGEYFGYARMSSPISGEAVAINPQFRQPETSETTTDGPKSIPTPATEWAPKGRIVDDSARGTIFWEADQIESAEAIQEEEEEQSKVQEQVDGSKQGQDWGKPFNIEWLSTNRLPFYRTRGLRNPWNANREVKIARDGTELEPSIGKRLVQMFHRPLVAPPPPVVVPQGGIMPMPMPDWQGNYGSMLIV